MEIQENVIIDDYRFEMMQDLSAEQEDFLLERELEDRREAQ
jgi:hypothetical protein